MARPRKEAVVEGVALTPAKAPEAFANVEAKLLAIPKDSVLVVESDVGAAVTIVLAALPKLRDLREAVATELPQHPVNYIDELEELAHAAWFADVLANHSGDSEAGKALIEEATTLREGLLIGAEALAFRGLMDKEQVAAIRRGHGDLDAAKDIVTLAQLFAAAWPQVAAKTAVEKKELERAAKLGPELMFALAAKKQATKKGSKEPSEIRARAFTLLVTAYEATRRAVTYLRWTEGDAETIAPPISKKRGPRKAKGEAEAAAPEAHTNGAAPIADEAAPAADA